MLGYVILPTFLYFQTYEVFYLLLLVRSKLEIEVPVHEEEDIVKKIWSNQKQRLYHENFFISRYHQYSVNYSGFFYSLKTFKSISNRLSEKNRTWHSSAS